MRNKIKSMRKINIILYFSGIIYIFIIVPLLKILFLSSISLYTLGIPGALILILSVILEITLPPKSPKS